MSKTQYSLIICGTSSSIVVATSTGDLTLDYKSIPKPQKKFHLKRFHDD